MLAISLFPMTFAESMAVIILKEAQGPWMAGIKTLESLTEEKHFARLKNPHANSQNNFNRGNNFNQNRGNNFNQGQIYRPPVNQPVAHQGPAPQTHGVSKTDFERYVTANDAVLRNMQNQGQNLQSQMANLTDMLSKFVTANTASTSGSGTLPGNTVTNPKEDLKGITTRSGVTIQGPKAVNHDAEVTKDTMPPANNGSTEDVQPPVVQIQSRNPNPEPNVAPVVAPVVTPIPKASIPFPSRRNDERRKEKANDQIEKFYEIFRDLSFEISFTDALMLMPKFASTLKTLIGNKEKLSELARTPLNENCSAVILNKLPKKLGDPGRFLIPCEFTGITTCNALADLGASINLMPYSVWNNLSLPELTPTCMTLELADRSITKPIGIAEDVFVNVGKFQFPADFVVVDFKPDPRVPLILGRCFLKTSHALIDVYEGEITLRVGKEAITFNLDQTSRYTADYNHMTVNKIDVIDMACDEYSQEVLGFSNVIASGNPTPYFEPIVSTASPNLTPFGDSDFLLMEEADSFLALEDDPTSSEVDPTYQDPEGDILLLEAILNSEPPPPLNMTPSHFNTYQSSYINPHFQQHFSPSQFPQYGSIHPTQHYSTTYPSTPRVITYLSTSHPNAYSSIVHQDACPQPQSIPQIEYTVSTVNQQIHLAEFHQIDPGLEVLMFKQGDDPIDAINKMMSFLSIVVTSR
ncbi:reverse transcriptase domain-containing protein, partial [Tanacetum coccineum]